MEIWGEWKLGEGKNDFPVLLLLLCVHIFGGRSRHACVRPCVRACVCVHKCLAWITQAQTKEKTEIIDCANKHNKNPLCISWMCGWCFARGNMLEVVRAFPNLYIQSYLADTRVDPNFPARLFLSASSPTSDVLQSRIHLRQALPPVYRL